MKKYLFGAFLGALAMFITLTVMMTNQYGRMANHKYCDMSLENLGSQEMSQAVYYERASRNK